jgi:NTE family protein
MARVFRARTGSLAGLFSGGLASFVQADGEALLQAFWPAAMPERIEDLRLPFAAVATDFPGRAERVFTEGPLRLAVAASMAIPGLVKPVLIDGRPHVDGAVVNPLPFDRMPAPCDLVVAVNVVGGRVAEDPGAMPSVVDATFGASLIMQGAIVDARLKLASTKVHVVEPAIGGFYALDFFGAKRILQAAEPVREEIAGLLRGITAAP